MSSPSQPSWRDLLKHWSADVNHRDGDVEVVFLDLRERLLRFIADSDAVVGCVAWLTDTAVIEALAARSAVSVIINKGGIPGKHGTTALRQLATSLRGSGLDSIYLSDLYYYLDSHGKQVQELDAVRCAGYTLAGRSPLLHHKFLVRCTRGATGLRADSVWTGSYNFTTPAAEQHFENAVIIDKPAIAERYRMVWEQVYLLSEPLFTKSEGSEPELEFNEALVPDPYERDDFINDEALYDLK